MHVTLLLADQCSAASATMAQEIFYAANLFAGQEKPLFELRTVSQAGRRPRHHRGENARMAAGSGF